MEAKIKRPYISTFVDDINIMSVKKSDHIEKVKQELATTLEIVDIGPINIYLGLKVKTDWAKRMMKLLEPAYIIKILTKYYLNQAKSCNIPINEGILLPNKCLEVTYIKQEQYQSMTGSLIFSMVETRLNIAFAISVLSHFTKNLSYQYIKVVKKIMQYFKAIHTLDIMYEWEIGRTWSSKNTSI